MNYKENIEYRKDVLKKLLNNLILHEDEIVEALYKDFKKPAFESVITETNYVITELKHTIKNMKSWSKRSRVLPSLINFPSRDYIYKEPYGKVLIIAPWNYPYQLALCPLVSAVAAGNQVVVKPSELTPNTSAIITKIIHKTFDINHVDVKEGGVEVSTQLLAQRWDYIFFTGSIPVGKIVAKAAAEHLTPTTLELGGKSPCIIDETANLKLAAKRIVWGKFLNAGQTCVAPDYLLVHQDVKSKFVDFLKSEITLAYSENPETSKDFARIVNSKNWERVKGLINPEKVIFGGKSSANSLYVAPTLVEETDLESAIMQEEIFGPVLPILTYSSKADIQIIFSKYEKPLALYVFTENNSFANEIIKKYSFGGGCVNDTVIHLSNSRLPFGGVGHSGSGAYHGKFSFDTFSHKKSMIKKATWLDLPLRYAPYKDKLALVKKLLKWT
ncbi:aldehyde dehydrogenase [Flavobacterium sp. F-380]|uniref:Aldehyde dehydrogenase n=1 Tax=Flavobacterium kayseriense TaxID=2764714 RepID=A0ABR7JAJ9_9FLAO|nr:aldehyde dehydrogenase [Flavobacterium kayseriense]MBC5842561.1 aldehyde dehydrogenase [Flavobacterium kayseriense]MBC5849091.1 aldehyde dehydrogenase [Flavobacterium kayseriense]